MTHALPVDDRTLFDRSCSILTEFGRAHQLNGRVIALYLSLRRMRVRSEIAELGSENATPASEIEAFADKMFTKTFREPPRVVLTALFGSTHDPFKTRSGERAPGNKSTTNNWRNNFQVQKGVGCLATADVVADLVNSSSAAIRDDCPFMETRGDGSRWCTVRSRPTRYRDRGHAIHLRQAGNGWQTVDLDLPSVTDPYFPAENGRLPIFPLIGVLYSFSPPGVYPDRAMVDLSDFQTDFGFSEATLERVFDCDPDSAANVSILLGLAPVIAKPVVGPKPPRPTHSLLEQIGDELPVLPPMRELNTGLAAELAVAQDLADQGWTVSYFGNRPGAGFDLLCTRDTQTIRVEVKSSIALCTPELTAHEWTAALQFADGYLLAVVDYVGAGAEAIRYVRDPAGRLEHEERVVSVYRIARSKLSGIAVSSAAV